MIGVLSMKVKRTVYTILLDVACCAILAGSFLYLLLQWEHFPEIVPSHYGFSGTPDRWSDKSSLLVTPLMALIIFCGITVTERFPQIWNTGVKVTEENRERVYSVLHHMISTIKFLSLVILTSISVIASLAKPIPLWFLLLSLLLLFGSMVFFLIKLFKGK